MTAICTGWHPEAWEEYARNFTTTFHRYWPGDITLDCYVENQEEHEKLTRGNIKSLWDCDGINNFMEIHALIPEHCGKAP